MAAETAGMKAEELWAACLFATGIEQGLQGWFGFPLSASADWEPFFPSLVGAFRLGMEQWSLLGEPPGGSLLSRPTVNSLALPPLASGL